MKKRNGFTLVELLAVIVILAIILVIAVPKVMSIIEDAKMGTLESTAKMIASGAEKQKVQNTVLGNDKEITCESVAKLNNLDYKSCTIEFDNNTAKVTIQGNGKFDNLWVCEGTKTNAVAQNSSCKLEIQSIEVEHPEFFAGETLSLDKFHVMATYSDGSKRILEDGTKIVGDESVEGTTITSPNWPEISNSKNEEENTWEVTYEGATFLEIKIDENSFLAEEGLLSIYDKDGNKIHSTYWSIDQYTYIVNGNYVKITNTNPYSTDFKISATIRPAKQIDAEYTVSPSVVPTGEETFDLTITTKEKNITKKLTLNTGNHNFGEYIESLVPFDDIFANSLMKTSITYNNNTYDAGTRYFGSDSTPKNNIYYNCEDIDTNGVAYGLDEYDFESSCEVWRIIGVFNVDDGNGNIEKRVKIINTNSIFAASWDSSASTINLGYGVNQWGESRDYEGADLMRLLNEYYISKEESKCMYCNGIGQETCNQICDTSEKTLKNLNMKPLTNQAKKMIKNAVWNTYAVETTEYGSLWDDYAESSYLEENGISKKYTGCLNLENANCENDGITRNNKWTGLVGLMSVSDALFADYGRYDGWLYSRGYTPWTITGIATSSDEYNIWFGAETYVYNDNTYDNNGVWPTVYLKPEVKVISGKGTSSNPYKLAL